MARREKLNVRNDARKRHGVPAKFETTEPAGREAAPVEAVASEWETLLASLRQAEAAGEGTARTAAWQTALLARWGRLHLLLAVIEPLLPADHPRLRLIRRALFGTYRDLKALGVDPNPIPAA